MGKTIPFPSAQLAGAGFVLRPFAARDYDAANAAREDEDTALWVNALPQPDGDAMSRWTRCGEGRSSVRGNPSFGEGDSRQRGRLDDVFAAARRSLARWPGGHGSSS